MPSKNLGDVRYFEDVAVGMEMPPVTKQIDLVRMMAYGAATWDFIRVHYDADYVRERGFPGPFVDGQMMGGFLAQQVQEWAGPTAFLMQAELSEPGYGLSRRFPGMPRSGDRGVFVRSAGRGLAASE